MKNNPLVNCHIKRRIQDFPEGTPTQKEGGCQPIIWAKLAENCMKIKKVGRGGASKILLCKSVSDVQYVDSHCRRVNFLVSTFHFKYFHFKDLMAGTIDPYFFLIVKSHQGQVSIIIVSIYNGAPSNVLSLNIELVF